MEQSRTEPAAEQQRPAEPEPTGPPAEPDLAAELARLQERYRRALADLDNYRKRAARDLERLTAERREALLRDWLDVVDGVERALRQHAGGSLAEGLRAVLDQMNTVLARQGVERIGAPGEPFDPTRAEAVAVRDSRGAPEGTILEVVRSGFAIDGHVLRPAEVVVARAPRSNAAEPGA